MPYYTVKVQEIITHEFIVKARDREQIEGMDPDAFADPCSMNSGYVTIDDRTIEDIEQTVASADEVHLDITEDD